MSKIKDSSSSNVSQNPSQGDIELYRKNKEAAKKTISDENNYFLQAKKNLKPTKNAEGILVFNIKDIEKYEIATSIRAVLESRGDKKDDQPKIEYIKKDINTEITEWSKRFSPQFELYSKITELKKEQQVFIKEISRVLSKEIEKSITKDKEEALKTVAGELAAAFENSNIRCVDSLNIDPEDFVNKIQKTISEKVEEALEQIPASDTSTRKAFENYNTIFNQLKSIGILNAFIDCNQARSCYVVKYLPEFIKQDKISPVVQDKVIEHMSVVNSETNHIGDSSTKQPIVQTTPKTVTKPTFDASKFF